MAGVQGAQSSAGNVALGREDGWPLPLGDGEGGWLVAGEAQDPGGGTPGKEAGPPAVEETGGRLPVTPGSQVTHANAAGTPGTRCRDESGAGAGATPLRLPRGRGAEQPTRAPASFSRGERGFPAWARTAAAMFAKATEVTLRVPGWEAAFGCSVLVFLGQPLWSFALFPLSFLCPVAHCFQKTDERKKTTPSRHFGGVCA